MSLLKRIKNAVSGNSSNTTNTPVPQTVTPVKAPPVLSTEINERSKVILSKAELGLEKHLVDLKKKNVDLTAHRARVFVILDRSGSMRQLYNNGSVQDTLTRLLPLALKFDDNGELEVYVFDDAFNRIEPMTINNFSTYVEKEILEKNYGPRGSTNYAPVINQATKDFNDGSPYPAFGIFITDGDNWDHNDTTKAIRNSSKYKIFFQFVGIGKVNFNYLQNLDNLDGRDVDNTSFIKIEDFSSLSDEELFPKLLAEYPQWLKDMHIQ